ncbi:MAG TPA: pilus assembly protein PilM, partial [Thermodesulfobacteriota bacterium]|nr:pilus assembly protein PilM [Thermodesulfobacteriota bacterium]
EPMAHNFNDMICGEIKRTLDFFSSTLWTSKVGSILIGGGSSKVPGLKALLEDLTEVNVDFMNPFRGIFYDKNEFDPEYIDAIAPKMCVVMGLATRKAGDKA